MTTPTPRISRACSIDGTRSVFVRFDGDTDDRKVDLSGWIATGDPILAPLLDARCFRTARVSEFKDAIEWGDEDSDLAIDAAHLEMISREQRPMSAEEIAAWQELVRLSNTEAASVLGVSRSTFAAYKAGANIPQSVGIACRAALRDPIILQAWLRPTPAPGRPRKAG